MNPEPPLPLPDTFESDTEIAWVFWDQACAEMDDMGEFALSHPLVNTRAELGALASSSVRSPTVSPQPRTAA